MRTVLFAAVAAALFLNPSTVAADPVKSGMEALKKNRYEESVNSFVSVLPSVKAGGGRFYLSFGVALFENARLYSELYGLSLTLHADHLTMLAAASGRDRSRFARLYLGKALLEAGRPKQAASHLERFISEKKAPQKYKNIARVGLGLSYFNQGMKKKALGIWGAIKSSDPDVISELAYIYSSLGIKGKDPVSVADRALGLAKKSKKRPSAALVTNLIGVYAEAGLIEKGFELLGGSDLKDHSYEESIGKNKVIRFYDTRLLGNLAAFYREACIKYLKKASEDAKVKGAAWFYLGEAYALSGDTAASAKALAAALSSGGLPGRLKDRAGVISAENLYREGRKGEGLGRLKTLYGGSPGTALIADVVFACARVGERCAEAVSKAESMSGASGGKKLAYLNHALGMYYLLKKDYKKAVLYMEEGRDKGNKNKIEYNDPKMLAGLSEAYYKTKQFSEALEIFFEMSRHFPAVRQIQVVLQGIYSVEQKSAGDVKIL